MKKILALIVIALNLASVAVGAIEYDEYKAPEEFTAVLSEDYRVPEEFKELLAEVYWVETDNAVVNQLFLEIEELVPERIEADRGYFQDEWYYSRASVKERIAFSEVMLKRLGASEELYENYYSIYKKMAENKVSGEWIALNDANNLKFVSDKFMKIVDEYGAFSDNDMRLLGILMYYDEDLKSIQGKEAILEREPYPFTIGENSRENLLIAASSLVGRVRYVWGGGHLEVSEIEGINPLWKPIFDSYGKEAGQPGYNMSIVPNRSWNPRRGVLASGNYELSYGSVVKNTEEFIRIYDKVLDIEDVKERAYKVLDGGVDYSKGVRAQRLEGLDCSGFTAWAFNQLQPEKSYTSVAKNWVRSNNFNVLPYGEKMEPGDIISWNTHIVMVVGEYRTGSGIYVVLESSPNMVKFGLANYGNAKTEEILEATKYVRSVNYRIGGIGAEENVNVHSLARLKSQLVLGRSNDVYEEVLVGFEKLEAPSVIEYIISRLPDYLVVER